MASLHRNALLADEALCLLCAAPVELPADYCGQCCDPTTLPKFGEVSTRPRCGVCHAVIVVDYFAANELWEAALHPSWRDGYVCIDCLASAADEKGLGWDRHIREIRLCSLAFKTAPTSFYTGGGQ